MTIAGHSCAFASQARNDRSWGLPEVDGWGRFCDRGDMIEMGSQTLRKRLGHMIYTVM